jgi:hypothetical protein
VRKILDYYKRLDKLDKEMYIDYLRMAQQQKYDLSNPFVSFPRHVQITHDQAAERQNANVKAIQDGAYKKLYALRKKQYTYRAGAFMVIVPEHIMEIVNEGHHLHHCVGSYASRVINGDTVILFVRRAENPALSFYTMEVNPETNVIRQCRGYSNRDMTDDVKAFIQSYSSIVLNGQQTMNRRKAG